MGGNYSTFPSIWLTHSQKKWDRYFKRKLSPLVILLACSSPLLNVFSRLLPLISIFDSHLLFAFFHDGFAATATRWKFLNQGVSGRRESRLRNFLPRNWEQSALNGSPVWYECLFLNWKIYRKILYPILVCFGYHFLENFPFLLNTEAGEGVWILPKSDDITYEQPLKMPFISS